MTVFKYFLKILGRYHLAAAMYVVMFAAMGIMAAQQDRSGQQYAAVKANIAVIDEDGGTAAQHLTEYLATGNTLRPAPEKQDIDEQIYMGLFDMVAIIPKGFAKVDSNQQIEVYQNTFSATAYKAVQDLSGYMYLLNLSRDEGGEINYQLLNSALQEKAEVRIVGSARRQTSQNEWYKRYMNAAFYPLTAIVIFVIGMVMADFNNKKIAFRNRCSGKSLRDFQIWMFIGQLIFGVLLWALLLVIPILVVRVDFHQINVGLYALNLAVLMVTTLCLAFCLNMVVQSKPALSAIANIFSLGSAFVSGAFIPQEFLGGIALKLAHFLPAYYFINANNDIYTGSGDWLLNMGIQLLFAASFLLGGYYLAKVHQREKALEF